MTEREKAIRRLATQLVAAAMRRGELPDKPADATPEQRKLVSRLVTGAINAHDTVEDFLQ